MLDRLRFIPETALGPVISAKFLSTTSTIMHFFPASRPTILTQILPTSIAGNFNPLHFDWEYTCLYFTHIFEARRQHICLRVVLVFCGIFLVLVSQKCGIGCFGFSSSFWIHLRAKSFLYIKNLLLQWSIENNLKYLLLVKIIPKKKRFICKVAKDAKDATELIEVVV